MCTTKTKPQIDYRSHNNKVGVKNYNTECSGIHGSNSWAWSMCSEKNTSFPCTGNINRSFHLSGQLITSDIKYKINSLYSESTRYLYQWRLENKFEIEHFQNVEDKCVYITKCIHQTARNELEGTENNCSLMLMGISYLKLLTVLSHLRHELGTSKMQFRSVTFEPPCSVMTWLTLSLYVWSSIRHVNVLICCQHELLKSNLWSSSVASFASILQWLAAK
jgi:hypothetical protein